MKFCFAVLLLCVANSSGFAQELSFEDYHNINFTVKKNQQKVGAFKTDGNTLIPAKYDALLPSMIDGLVFYRKSGALGLLDYNKRQRVFQSSMYDAIKLMKDTDGQLHIDLQRMEYGRWKSIESMTLKEDSTTGKWEVGAEKVNPSFSNEFYQDGIARFDRNRTMHLHAAINVKEGTTKHLLKSGIYNQSSNSFDVPAIHYDFFIIQNADEQENKDFFCATVLNSKALLSYQVYDQNLKTIGPRFEGPVFSAGNGCIYGPLEGELKVFNRDSKELLSLNLGREESRSIIDVRAFKDHYLIMYKNNDPVCLEMQIPTVEILNSKGKLVKQEAFKVLNRQPLPTPYLLVETYNGCDTSLSTCKEHTGFFTGIYNLAEGKFFKPFSCAYIAKETYRDNLFKCHNENCDDYFRWEAKNTEYFDMNMQTISLEGGLSYEKPAPSYTEWGEPNRINFEPASEHIKDSITVYLSPEKGGTPGKIIDNHSGVEIYQIVKTGKYGLRYSYGGGNILHPDFEKMALDKTNNALSLSYNGKQTTISLARYKIRQR